MSEAAAQPLNEEYVCSDERWGPGGGGVRGEAGAGQ